MGINSGGLVPGGAASGGSATPSGPAGGDLTGTYPNPTIKASVGLTGSPTSTTQTTGDSSTKIATDQFVATAIANAIAGVNPAIAVLIATTAAADTSGMTYANGVAGIGATLTGPNNTAITIDGTTFTAVGQRLLVKNDTQSPSGAFNGIYTLTALQTAITGAIFTRSLDYDTPSDINNTGAIPVQSGTANALTSWLLTSQVTTVGTDALTYSKFTSATVISGGQGIQVVGGVVGLNGTEAVNVVATSGASQTLAAVATDVGNDVTLSASCTFTMPAAARGAFCYIIVRQAGAGGPYTATFTSVKWPGGTAPTMSTAASAVDRYDFVSDGTNWYGVISGQSFS